MFMGKITFGVVRITITSKGPVMCICSVFVFGGPLCKSTSDMDSLVLGSDDDLEPFG